MYSLQTLGKFATLKVCRFMSVLTPMVDDDIKRQVFNILGSSKKIFYASLQLKFTLKEVTVVGEAGGLVLAALAGGAVLGVLLGGVARLGCSCGLVSH